MTVLGRVVLASRWKPWSVIGLAAVPLLGVPVGYVATGAGAVGGTAAIAAVLADPLAVLAGRSPGQRAAGALAQTKRAYAHAAPRGGAPGAGPRERVLANVRTRPPVTFDPAMPVFDIPDFVGDLGSLSPASIAPGAAVADLAPAPSVGPGIGSVSFPSVGSGGTGGTGGAGGTTPGGGGDVVQPAAPGVPEPATWLTMLAGVFAIAATLRQRALSRQGAGRAAAISLQR